MQRRNAIILRSINWRRDKLTCRNKHVGVASRYQGDAPGEWTSRETKEDRTIHGDGKMSEKRDANALPEVSGGIPNVKREVCLMVRTVEREMRGERVSKGQWEVITGGWWKGDSVRWRKGRGLIRTLDSQPWLSLLPFRVARCLRVLSIEVVVLHAALRSRKKFISFSCNLLAHSKYITESSTDVYTSLQDVLISVCMKCLIFYEVFSTFEINFARDCGQKIMSTRSHYCLLMSLLLALGCIQGK